MTEAVNVPAAELAAVVAMAAACQSPPRDPAATAQPQIDIELQPREGTVIVHGHHIGRASRHTILGVARCDITDTAPAACALSTKFLKSVVGLFPPKQKLSLRVVAATDGTRTNSLLIEGQEGSVAADSRLSPPERMFDLGNACEWGESPRKRLATIAETRRVLSSVAAAASKDTDRPLLNRISLKRSDSGITAVASDNYKLISARIRDAEWPTADTGESFTVPLRLIKWLKAATRLSKTANRAPETEYVTWRHLTDSPFARSDTAVTEFHSHGCVYTCAPVEGEYPPWRKAFPADTAWSADFGSETRKMLLSVVTKAKRPVVKGSTQFVRLAPTVNDYGKVSGLEISQDTLTNEERDRCWSTIASFGETDSVYFSGEQAKPVAVNAEHFETCLKAASSSGVVLKVADTLKPVVLESALANRMRSAIMPARVR